MMPLWYQSLSGEFQDKLKKQDMIDLTFYCSDGAIGGHQFMIALSSSFLSDVLSSAKVYDVDMSVFVPDLTVSQVSLFLIALYGGPVSDKTTLLEVVELLYVDLTSTGLHLHSIEETYEEPMTVLQEEQQFEEIEQTEIIIPGNC